MSSPDWMNGFVLGQHASSSADTDWQAFAEQQKNIIQEQAQRILDLRQSLLYQTSVAEANKKTGQRVLEELQKVAPNSPLSNPDRVKKIGQIYFQEAQEQNIHRI